MPHLSDLTPTCALVATDLMYKTDAVGVKGQRLSASSLADGVKNLAGLATCAVAAADLATHAALVNGVHGLTAGISAGLTAASAPGAGNPFLTTNQASSNPGASAKILMSDSSGYLQLTRIGLGVTPSFPLHVSGNSRLAYDASNYTDIYTESYGYFVIRPSANVVDLRGPDVNTGGYMRLTNSNGSKQYITFSSDGVNTTYTNYIGALFFNNVTAFPGGNIIFSATTDLSFTAGSSKQLYFNYLGRLGVMTSDPQARLHVVDTDAVTNTIVTTQINAKGSSGTPAAGFGTQTLYQLQSSTTAGQSAAAIDVLWNDATHASRKADLVLSAYDTAKREGIRIRGNGVAAAIGFYGATPQAQQTGVAVTAAAIHAALVNLGLITA